MSESVEQLKARQARLREGGKLVRQGSPVRVVGMATIADIERLEAKIDRLVSLVEPQAMLIEIDLREALDEFLEDVLDDDSAT